MLRQLTESDIRIYEYLKQQRDTNRPLDQQVLAQAQDPDAIMFELAKPRELFETPTAQPDAAQPMQYRS